MISGRLAVRLAWAWLLVLGACGKEQLSATAVAVSVKSELGAELIGVSYRVFRPEADPARDAPVSELTVDAGTLFRPFVVVRGESETFLLVVDGLGAAGRAAPLVSARVRARFEPGKTLRLPVFLSRACLQNSCAEPPFQTCLGEPRGPLPAGSCAPIPGPDVLTPLGNPDDVARWQPIASPPSALDGGALGTEAGDAGSVDASAPAPESCEGFVGDTCDPARNCGCPAGEQCQPRLSGPSACRPIGTVRGGGLCQSDGDCALGLGCWIGVCRPICDLDADCGMGGRCRPGSGIPGYCYMPCGRIDDAPCAAGSQCAPLRIGDAAAVENICLVVSDPCPFTNDGTCDEVGAGLGLCASGTDAADCCRGGQPRQCDLFTQCGCPRNEGCFLGAVSGRTVQTTCAPAGTKPVGTPCTLEGECVRGAICAGSLCKRVCKTDGDCGANQYCAPVSTGAEPVDGLGVCTTLCDFDTGRPCQVGTVCARWLGRAFCIVQDPSGCPLAGDGKCDETTRICRAGTDPDCAR